MDWSKKQLLKGKISGVIVLSTGEHSNDFFSGVAIRAKSWFVGYFSNTWKKSDFQPLTETITLTFENK